MGNALHAADLVAYRRSLSAFATGVVLVTTLDPQGPVGLIANSFTSVSLDPPRILWCLGDRSDRGVFFRNAERFAVNILSAEAQGLAGRYAARGNHRLADEDMAEGEGCPAVVGALTTLQCRTVDRLPIADHLVIVGEVESFAAREGDGLTWFRSGYGRAAEPGG